MPTQFAVEFREVTYRAGGKPILDQLSFGVEPGETLVLLGRSGSGKTTALKMVNGLLFPSGGQVLVDGKPTVEWDLIRLRRGIGYVSASLRGTGSADTYLVAPQIVELKLQAKFLCNSH